MSRVTVQRIVRQYKAVGANPSQLHSIVNNHTKGKKKYADESSIVNYIQKNSEPKDFQRIISVSRIIEILKEKFGSQYDFRRSKIASMMNQAGLKFKNVKIDIVKDPKVIDLLPEQKTHLAKLVRDLNTTELIIFVDET